MSLVAIMYILELSPDLYFNYISRFIVGFSFLCEKKKRKEKETSSGNVQKSPWVFTLLQIIWNKAVKTSNFLVNNCLMPFGCYTLM